MFGVHQGRETKFSLPCLVRIHRGLRDLCVLPLARCVCPRGPENEPKTRAEDPRTAHLFGVTSVSFGYMSSMEDYRMKSMQPTQFPILARTGITIPITYLGLSTSNSDQKWLVRATESCCLLLHSFGP